jgi:hypothetical protein
VQKKIEYEQLLRKASLSVVKEILKQIATYDLYKRQHIYITFATNHSGVKISDLLRNDFDDEMTIVLQYEFWDLIIDDLGFSISLAFEHSDETLYIPFTAIISVSDPSEDFSLEFVPDFAEMKTVATEPQKKNSPGKIISIDTLRK